MVKMGEFFMLRLRVSALTGKRGSLVHLANRRYGKVHSSSTENFGRMEMTIMKKKVGLLLCFLVMGGLVSCNIPPLYPDDSSQGEIEQQYHSVSQLLTQTAQVSLAAMTVPVTSVTPSPVSQTALPTDDSVALVVVDAQPDAASATPTSKTASTQAVLAAPCNLAQLGYPIDISVPDGTQFLPGQPFSKTWRLVNAGSCEWTPDYALVWFSGTDLGLNPVQPINSMVHWGSSIDITVDMVAPEAPGTYQSNWKMQDPQGALFGIGPNGDAPIWVRIVVVPLDTPTPAPTLIEATPTPSIYASGTFTLMVGEGIDLDSAQINPEQGNDVRFLSPVAGEFELAPLNGVHLGPFGNDLPQLFDCNQSDAADTPLVLAPESVGESVCYRTAQGLPGRLTIRSVDLEKGQVDLEFITWVVP